MSITSEQVDDDKENKLMMIQFQPADSVYLCCEIDQVYTWVAWMAWAWWSTFSTSPNIVCSSLQNNLRMIPFRPGDFNWLTSFTLWSVDYLLLINAMRLTRHMSSMNMAYAWWSTLSTSPHHCTSITSEQVEDDYVLTNDLTWLTMYKVVSGSSFECGMRLIIYMHYMNHLTCLSLVSIPPPPTTTTTTDPSLQNNLRMV